LTKRTIRVSIVASYAFIACLLAEKNKQCLSAFVRVDVREAWAKHTGVISKTGKVDCTNFQGRSYIEAQFTDNATLAVGQLADWSTG